MDFADFLVLTGEIQVRFLKVSEGKKWCASSEFHLQNGPEGSQICLASVTYISCWHLCLSYQKLLGKLAVLQLPSDSG